MFIDGQKYKQLREAAKNGDERAKKILQMQYHQEDGLDGFLNDYFNPKKEVEVKDDIDPKLAKFLKDNNTNPGDSDYDETVAMFYQENPKQKDSFDVVIDKLIEDEIEAIESYDKALLSLINDNDFEDSVKNGLSYTMQEIKQDEIEHIEKLKKIKEDLKKGIVKDEQVI